MSAIWLSYGAALGIAAIAAITDFRTGLIPNWLTLPPLAIAPVAYGILLGWKALLLFLLSALLCALVPFVLFCMRAAGGGDVKLLAAIGAVAGLSVGLFTQVFALACAALFTLGRLAWRGKLAGVLRNMLFLALNPLLPRGWRKEVSPESLTMVRLGPFIFLGTLLAIAQRYFFP